MEYWITFLVTWLLPAVHAFNYVDDFLMSESDVINSHAGDVTLVREEPFYTAMDNRTILFSRLHSATVLRTLYRRSIAATAGQTANDVTKSNTRRRTMQSIIR